MSRKKAQQMLSEMKKDYRCYVNDETGRMWTVQELLSIALGKPVEYDEGIEFLLSPAKL